jgi:hypothetical protein
MLNAHPKIVFPPESHFIRKYIIPEMKSDLSKFYNFHELDHILKNDPHLQRLEIDSGEVLRPFSTGEKAFSFHELFINYLQIYAKRFDKSIIGEKDPGNTRYIREIQKIFPDAYVIHIIRDPRDVILSRMKKSMSSKRQFFRYVRDYREYFCKAFHYGPRLFGDRYIEIRYEDLVLDPENELKNLCQKLGVEFCDVMLQYYNQTHEVVSFEEKEWKQNVFKPIIKDNTQKWKHSLDRWQILTIEGVCWKALAHCGYPQSESRDIFTKQLYALPVYGYAGVARIKRTARRIVLRKTSTPYKT